MNNIDETGMPTDAYITVNANGIFIDGKPARKYHGYNIWDIPYIKEVFAWMQAQNPDVEEFHIGAFATRGDKMGQTGNPSLGFGPHAWCRLKFKNGKYGAWVFGRTNGSAASCANNCADDCAYAVRHYAGFRAAVFRAPIDKTPQPKTPMENKQQNNDMPTDAYITVKRNEKGEVDIYVGGKPARKYRGYNIWEIPYIKEVFAWMQAQNPDVEEFHVGAFETPGGFARSGNPSSGFGPHAWCRLKFKNGKYGAWVFFCTGSSAANCAYYCASFCASRVCNDAGFRAAVFRAPIDKTPQPKTPMENKQQNNDMPTDAYITVNANGIFIDGKPARKYHGYNIWEIPYIKEVFAWMQAQNPDVEEFHVGAFETPGEFARSGNPSSGFGPHAWCRLKFKNGKYGSWVFFDTYSSATLCAVRCANDCAYFVRDYAGFRAAVFRAPIDKTVQPKTPVVSKDKNNNNTTVGIDGKGLAQFIVNSVYGKQK